MAKKFKNVKYETDAGQVYYCRAATSAVIGANAEAVGSISDTRMRVKVGESTRKRGVQARGLYLYRVAGTVADVGDVIKTTFLPVFTPTAFNAFTTDQTVTVDGVNWKVRSFRKEG